mmetsp:Transcript_27188/g.62679  ORF Transcript_27188/g.62679 Transcript_27188/m.62679 type:complete len:351 (+) Transcript_27188:143-1195(+)
MTSLFKGSLKVCVESEHSRRRDQAPLVLGCVSVVLLDDLSTSNLAPVPAQHHLGLLEFSQEFLLGVFTGIIEYGSRPASSSNKIHVILAQLSSNFVAKGNEMDFSSELDGVELFDRWHEAFNASERWVALSVFPVREQKQVQVFGVFDSQKLQECLPQKGSAGLALPVCNNCFPVRFALPWRRNSSETPRPEDDNLDRHPSKCRNCFTQQCLSTPQVGSSHGARVIQETQDAPPSGRVDVLIRRADLYLRPISDRDKVLRRRRWLHRHLAQLPLHCVDVVVQLLENRNESFPVKHVNHTRHAQCELSHRVTLRGDCWGGGGSSSTANDLGSLGCVGALVEGELGLFLADL